MSSFGKIRILKETVPKQMFVKGIYKIFRKEEKQDSFVITLDSRHEMQKQVVNLMDNYMHNKITL